MSHFEKLIFKPNPGTYELACHEIKDFLNQGQKYQQHLVDWLKSDPTNLSSNLDKLKNLFRHPLEKTFQYDFTKILDPTYVPPAQVETLTFNNGSKVTFNDLEETISWVNTNPYHSVDCLKFLSLIINYQLWQPVAYASWQTGKGPQKQLKHLGWKNPNYRKWFKKSHKI